MVSILPLISFMINQIVSMKEAETSAFRRRHSGLIVTNKNLAKCSCCTLETTPVSFDYICSSKPQLLGGVGDANQ